MEGVISPQFDSINIPGFLFWQFLSAASVRTDGRLGRALREVLEGLADSHTGPVKGPGQGDEDQEQQHGP